MWGDHPHLGSAGGSRRFSWIGSLNLSYKRRQQVSWRKCPSCFRCTNSNIDALILMKNCNNRHFIHIGLFPMLCGAWCGGQDVVNARSIAFWELHCVSVRYNQENMPLCLCSHHCPPKMALVSALSSLSGGVRNCQVFTEIHRGAAHRRDAGEQCTHREKWAGVLVVHTGAALASPPPPSTTWANNSRHQRVGQIGNCNFKAFGSPVVAAKTFCWGYFR